MKKQISRIISFVVIFTMLLSLVSVSVGAAESATESAPLDENTILVENENVTIFNDNTNLEGGEVANIISENLTIDAELEYGRIPKDDESDVLVNNVVTTATSTIASGVYKIKNAYNGMYLNVAGTGADAGSAIQQRTGTSTDNNLNQLFKITYLGVYGSPALEYYSIRPMTNSRLGLETSLSGTTRYATVETISTNDAWSSLLYNHLWAISANGSAYTIKNGSASTSSYLTAPANYTQGAAVYTTTSIGSSSKWVFEAYSGEELDHIAWPSKTTVLIAGASFDYDAYMYSSQIGVNGPLTFSVTNTDGSSTDKATINSSTGVVQALRPGQIRVRATYAGAPWIWYWTVTIKECFVQDLVDEGLVTPNDISYTDDGFYLLTVPLSQILYDANIYAIYTNPESQEDLYQVLFYYDDWYIYAIEDSSGYVYSLLKMREDEEELVVPDDEDYTGVTVPFVELDYNQLLSLIDYNTFANNYRTYLNLLDVTGPGVATRNVALQNYFSSVYSKAPYLIVEEFIKVIIRESCVNGKISAPKLYVEIRNNIDEINAALAGPLDDESRAILLNLKGQYLRITNAIQANNVEAGYSVFNTSTNTINISNPNNLTMYEKYAILISHTSNVTYNSFAAEVQRHAIVLSWLEFEEPLVYERALRADMAIGEEAQSGISDDYYDLNSNIVRSQASVHGEY
jgi:hypothetical protein